MQHTPSSEVPHYIVFLDSEHRFHFTGQTLSFNSKWSALKSFIKLFYIYNHTYSNLELLNSLDFLRLLILRYSTILRLFKQLNSAKIKTIEIPFLSLKSEI